MPTSHDYFDWFGFSNECTPELINCQRKLIDILEKSVANDKTIDEIIAEASHYAVEAQYTGFMQGIRLACALFCENN